MNVVRVLRARRWLLGVPTIFSVAMLGVMPQEALRMASLYPARFLGLDDRLGLLAPGYRADLVLLDQHLHPLTTWVAGSRAGPA